VFTFAAVMREAVDDNRIARNPVERIKIGAKTERRVDPMHIAGVSAQVPALAEAMPERWRAAVLLMATTGLRLGECLGLTVDRVDFLRRSIRVDRQLGRSSGFGPPKTAAGRRSISVPKSVTDMRAAHLSQFPAGDDGLIFTVDSGRAVPRSTWSDHYRSACISAGIDGRTRTHDLRHVAASALIAGGLSVAAVQAVLGHHSASETLDVYTHLWPTDEDRTREAMERAAAGWLSGVG
jgi:integrase